MMANLDSLRKDFVVYRTEEFPRLLHAFKAALAVIISMLICMRLELRGPGTAMVSAVIVMLAQQSGMVIARAFYRSIGFCCGSLAGLTLISLFAQQPVFFLAGLSLWVGFCVAGSYYYKNYQSYGFVLSGYVACIATLVDWHNPYDVTDNVIYTLSEVAIGVSTGSLVSALVFPQKVVPSLAKWRDTALSSLLSALRVAAQNEAKEGAPNGTVESFMPLVTQSVAIEGLRTAAVFEEPDMRLHNETLLRIDQTFLNAIASVFAVYRAKRLTAEGEFKGREEAGQIFDKLVSIVSDADADNLKTADRLDHLHNVLRAMEQALPRDVARQVSEEKSARTLEMGGAEVYLAVCSLREFCGACTVMFEAPKIQFMRSIVHTIASMRNVPIRSSALSAIASGLRATLAVGVVGAAWILSSWTNGYSAVVSAAITSGFFSLSPAPAPASWQAFVGCFLACIVGFAVNFTFMPVFDDVTVLALCFGLAIFLGSYLNTFVRYASLGAGFNIYFCYVLTPTNLAVYDPPAFLDRAFALLVGIGASAIAFSLVAPREGERLAKRYAARIRELIQDAATGQVDPEDAAQIETAMRDLIVRIVTVPQVSKDFQEQTARWAFGQLWIINTLLEVRSLGAPETHALPAAWNEAQRDWLDAIAKVARCADTVAIKVAVAATERGLSILTAHIDQISSNDSPVFKVSARLYSTLAALTDQLNAAVRFSGSVS
jgi:uncharacterized membrane protein YccC